MCEAISKAARDWQGRGLAGAGEGGPVRGLVRGRVRGRVVVQGAMAALTCNQSMATTAAANVARIAGKKHTQN